MTKTLLFTATLAALALGFSATVSAHGHCRDEACGERLLFDAGEAKAGGQGDVIATPGFGAWGFDTQGMGRGVRPGVDFFEYANGAWAKNTPIPTDRSNYGVFHALRDLSEARLHKLVESYVTGDPARDGDAAKIAAIYRGFMDEAALEKLGMAPLKPEIAAIRAITDKPRLAAWMGRANERFGGSFFSVWVSDDQRDPDHYTLYMSQSGLGLGDRQMYLEETFAPQRARYQRYVEQMLGMVGWPEPARDAAAIVEMEKRIAEAHWTRAASRDRDKTYNPVEMAKFAAYAPGFPWADYFKAAGLARAPRVVVRQDTALPKLAAIFNETALDTLKAWAAFQTADEAAPLLSKPFVDAHFEFRSKFMSGQPEQRERWKRGVALADEAMGEAIGRDYVKLYFPAESKTRMDELVANVKAAMGARLAQLEWMGAETKREAAAKLANFGLKIGYPGKWRDYSALDIRNGDVFGNALRSRAFEWNYRRGRLGQKVDKAEWGMTPQTVNAYYNSVKNEIVFPAAILQPPFFDPKADPAVNYGAIGGVIGHEIIHGFDDQGRKSDGAGVLRDWWSPQDAAKFEAQAARLGAQYESYSFPQLPGMRINGKVSMGENIGDLGGLTIALDAWRSSLGGQPAPVIEGFSGEQRFFLGWAQVWRTLWRDDALRQQLVNGPHSPGQIRAFAPLRNIDAWYGAFDVQPGDALYIEPEERVRIW
ncbi:M13 family peptidase [Lysobacter pythonis]|uniref:M13 family peptidase n=1 Tax=Solilutibacter pythonis TaxID=2483112 RepID=A0A3M2HSI7_9GAMM|nr:M13-type metalloendopeptidase [Lysobacter pythonis]RMH90793.1 M13 family peptidase [Lysobacter pythonis]